MPLINFGRSSRKGKEDQISGGRLINGYVEVQGETGKSQLPVYVVPGLTRWDNGTYEGEVRGLHSVPRLALYAVIGGQLIKFTSGTVHSVLGGISDTGPVFMDSNMRTEPEISILTAGGTRYIVDSSTDTITEQTDTGLPVFNGQSYLDNYFVYSTEEGQIYHSDQNDGSTINALAFATAESDSDGLQIPFSHRGAIVALGVESAEIWENVGTTPFAFDPIRADIDVGCMARHTVAEVKQGLAWVDQDGVVRLMHGSNPSMISTHDVTRDINALTVPQREAMRAIVYNFEGHEVYSLTSEAFTWEWNATTGEWHERKSLGHNSWVVNEHAFHDGKEIVGGQLDGKLYYVDPSADSDDGLEIMLEAHSPIIHVYPNQLAFNSIEIDAIIKAGAITNVDSNLMLSYSDDGGATWSNERRHNFYGEHSRRKRIRFNRLGRTTEVGRIFKITAHTDVCRGLMNVNVETTRSSR